MEFSPDRLLQALQAQQPMPGYHVAFSGGMDSRVLLQALAALRDRLDAGISAVHVHHGLQPEADEWQAHCAAVCNELGVPFEALTVKVETGDGLSPEAAARDARYAALAGWLPKGHALLSAHHLDDQAETLLLQLLRGSGVNGLAAMPKSARLGEGWLLRPLMDFSRASLMAWAGTQSLQWVEDPSNRDPAFDRNFLRQQVMPLLEQRWPSAVAGMARSAAHCAEAAGLLREMACEDAGGAVLQTLPVRRLEPLSPARLRNLLRYWLQQAGGGLPSTAVLARMQQDLLHSREDAEPCVRWGGHELRRYRGALYLLDRAAAAPELADIDWRPGTTLDLPGANGELGCHETTGQGIRRQAVVSGGVHVGWRRGGETCRPAGRGGRHSLKKLFQERGVPPWERSRIPLVFIDGELAAVADMWVCEPFQAGAGEPGLAIDWKRPGAPV